MQLQSAIDDLTRRGAERGVDLTPGLAAVETQLRETVTAEQPFTTHASRYLVDAGGKRFRPMLVLLSGMVSGAQPTHPDLVSAAVIVELVHISTLYHDDVIDAADTRRGSAAAHVKFSNTVAVLAGDFVLARASELSSLLGVEVTRLMAATIADLCRGQIREVQGSREAALHGADWIEPDTDHYLQVITEKTASLIAASCRLGAILTGAGPAVTAALTTYGRHLGLSFQLADDVLDITSGTAESGKVRGTDLKEGVRTLPVLLALDADGPDSELARLLADPTTAAVDKAVSILTGHPAIEAARQAARDEAAAARAALDGLAVDRGRAAVLDGLRYLADFAANRAG